MPQIFPARLSRSTARAVVIILPLIYGKGVSRQFAARARVCNVAFRSRSGVRLAAVHDANLCIVHLRLSLCSPRSTSLI